MSDRHPDNDKQPHDQASADNPQAGQADAGESVAVESFPRRVGNFWLRAYCWLLILGTLYVLSIGPLYQSWYHARHVGGSRLILIFYAPLAILCESWPAFDKWMNWYIALWS